MTYVSLDCPVEHGSACTTVEIDFPLEKGILTRLSVHPSREAVTDSNTKLNLQPNGAREIIIYPSQRGTV